MSTTFAAQAIPCNLLCWQLNCCLCRVDLPHWVKFCYHNRLRVLQGQKAGQNQQGGGCAGRFVKTAFYAVASGFGFTLGSDAANDVVHGVEGL